MATFHVKSRVTHPAETTTVEAETREEAIQKTLDAAEEGDEVEVMDVKPDPTAAGAGSPTGATGGTRTTAGPAKPKS